MPRSLPFRHAAFHYMHRRIAEIDQPARRLIGDAVAAVDQHNPTGAPWYETARIEFEPAVGQVDREQRVPGAVLALLADIEKRDLAVVAEPFPHGCDINVSMVRHVWLLRRSPRYS